MNACIYHGQTYEENVYWIVPVDASAPNGEGTSMRCYWNAGSQAYESKVYGWSTTNTKLNVKCRKQNIENRKQN